MDIKIIVSKLISLQYLYIISHTVSEPFQDEAVKTKFKLVGNDMVNVLGLLWEIVPCWWCFVDAGLIFGAL